ncbi:MAG TPA: alanine racemase, partial [Blastocatellia bacterium]|nr:alanine racemase [Blastocatellia bacterium]
SREFIGSRTRVMAVVKADAYGHGAAPCANRLQSEGVDWFGVAILEEGLELRNAGITKPILLLGGFWPGQENALLESSLTPAIFRIESAEALDSAAAARGITANFHLKIDTGMGRV